MSRTSLFLASLLCLLVSTVSGAQSYTSVLIFGDSLSDTGNFAHLTQNQYVVRVPGPIANYTDGRFTDGTLTSPAAVNYTGVWIEQLAATFPAKPPILNSLDKDSNGAYGTNYAYGFAATGDGTSVYTTTVTLNGAQVPISITVKNIGQQVLDYLSATPTVPANTLVVVWGGANDLLTAAAAPGASQASIQAAITTAVTAEITDVQRLIAKGAKNIVVPNLPPLGDIPRLNTSATFMPLANLASSTFNAALKAGLTNLQTASPGVTLNQLDIFTLFTSAIASPSTAGFANVTLSSQGVTGINPDTYLFWDDLHPTTAGHHAIAVAAGSLIAPAVTTTTALTTSALTANVGTAITFTANVSATAGSPAGTVTFLDGATPIGTGTLTTNGSTISSASFSTTALAAGPHIITAAFAGTTGFSASTSNTLTETITVPAIATTTVLTSSATTANVGSSVVFTAKVAAATGSPTGTVTFSDGSTSLGTGTITAGTATFTTTTLAAGAHTITATYGGGTGFLGSTSNAVTETIVAPSFAAALSPATLTLTSGSAGTSTVTVTPTGGYSGTIALACSGLPSMATCAISPNSLVFTASSTAQTATVKISTNSTSPASAALLLFPLSGIGMLLALRRRRSNPGLLLLLLILSGAGLFGFTGCGGSSPSTTTPTGTYPVTVTLTPTTGAATTLNLSLIVQ